ncbi:hypothetical protein D9619_000857 [Psilocybe cf. subviscida]|uniref:C2 domain-containing protein n=1 Tax=Psilocybe cf. subviscida TaxID=2480587 RepID=A0A8H5BD02_9AGAR|nr:hypothetical protein D9619_000857 [Psilocybe cf. subviscida]
MSATPREIGTLIAVVIRANHLPNKRHIGKQDPYCLVIVNGEKRRTKAIKRGGQHPEWDEEIRFTLYEDTDDVLARTARGDGTPPPLPPKDNKKTLNVKGGKTMKVACYADDPREPDLIGECEVDLTEVLTKGETDEWFQLSNKDKFAGRVYLELTFWSNAPPPEKKAAHKVVKNNTQYGGPGSFVPLGDPRAGSGDFDHTRQSSDIIPSSLRASTSGANLYVAPYERSSNVDKLAQEFGDLGLFGARRRESIPPVHPHYAQIPQYASQSAFANGSHLYGHAQSAQLGHPQSYSYENDQATQYPQTTYSTLNGHSQGYQAQAYDAAPQMSHHPVARGPRHSVPTASSGFIPLSVHGSLPSHVSEPSGFHPPPSHTPAPVTYQSQFISQPQQPYPPLASHTPASQVNNVYLPQSSSLSFQPQQQLSSPQQYAYNYIPSSTSAPQQQYVTSPPSQSTLHIQQPNSQPVNTIPHQSYSPNMTSPHEILSPTSPQHLVPSTGQSRPLPQQPQVVYTQPPVQPPQPIPTSLPPPGSLPQAPTYAPPAPPPNVYQNTTVYSAIPPPPPPPPIQYTAGVIAVPNTTLPVPPPPPPPLASSPNPQRRRASLPQPPVSYSQQNVQSVYQLVPPPPPPPPPAEHFNRSPLPPPPPPPLDYGTTPTHAYSHQDLPKPPSQVDEHGLWVQPGNVY